MFKKFMTIVMMVVTLSGCSINPFIETAKADNEEIYIEEYEGMATLTITKLDEDKYEGKVVLTKEGCDRQFGNDIVQGCTYILTFNQEGYDEIVADLVEQGYDI